MQQPVALETGDATNQPSRIVPCHDPATLEPLGSVVAMTLDEVRAIVERGRAAQRAWGKTSFAERRAVLRDILDHIVAHQEEICRLCVRDSGKTMVDASLGEVFPVCEKIRYVIENGEKDLRPEPRASGFLMHKKAWVEYQPLGVVGVLCPWNFPFHNLFCPTVPALFAGNAVVAKVSEHTSWSAAPLCNIFREVLKKRGHDADLVQIVTGYGETGAALVKSGVDKIFFTGSPANGKKVMATASDGLVPVVLELGGKDPMLVLEDADLEHATSQAMLGVFTACGQMCVGVERVYVMDSVYDEFVRRVTEKASSLRQGAPLRDVVDVGAMTMPRQLDIIEELLADATKRGARILVGGRRRPDLGGQFFEPTVLVDVDHTMRIAKEEQFGPVMVIMKVRSEEEAIRLANDTAYGLGASVFTKDVPRGERVARRIRAGMTVVNDYGLAYMIQALPFGGVGVSGFGRINGREGLRACCLEKAMVSDRIRVGGGVSVYPIRPATFDLTRSVISTIYGSSFSSRARAAASAVKSLVSILRS